MHTMENYERIKYEPLADSVFNYLFSDRDMNVSMQEFIDSVLTDAGDPLIGTVKAIQTQYDVKSACLAHMAVGWMCV